MRDRKDTKEYAREDDGKPVKIPILEVIIRHKELQLFPMSWKVNQ